MCSMHSRHSYPDFFVSQICLCCPALAIAQKSEKDTQEDARTIIRVYIQQEPKTEFTLKYKCDLQRA